MSHIAGIIIMIVWIAFLVFVSGSDDKCPLLCGTINPKFRHSCCKNKLCSDCYRDLKDGNIEKCPWCRSAYLTENVPDWRGEELKEPDMSQEEFEKVKRNNKNDYQSEKRAQHIQSRQSDMNDEELGRRFVTSASIGSLEMLQIVLSQQMQSRIPDEHFGKAWSAAAENNHLEILKFFISDLMDKFENISSESLGKAWAEASYRDHIEVLEFLSKHRFEDVPSDWFGYAWEHAANNGHLEVLEFLLKHRFQEITSDWLGYAWMSAAKNGHLEVLEFLLKHRFEDISLDDLEDAWEFAAKIGHLEVLKYLSENQFTLNHLI